MYVNAKSLLATLMLPLTLSLTACGEAEEIGEAITSLGETVIANAGALNQAPSVNAGQDQSVDATQTAYLSAAATDSDGTISSYSWSQIGGQMVTLSNASDANASFTAPDIAPDSAAVLLTFAVTVTDNSGLSATDSVTFTVNPSEAAASAPQIPANIAPVVNAGDDLSVEQQAEVILNAAASDSDGDIYSYEWNQIGGDYPVTLNNAYSAQASFTAPVLVNSEQAENYIFAITVTDDDGATHTDNVTVTVNPAPQTSGIATLSWAAPIENTDSSELTDLAGYKVYYGESADSLDETILIEDPATTAWVLESLNANTTYYFAVTAVNSLGVESDFSEIVSKTIAG